MSGRGGELTPSQIYEQVTGGPGSESLVAAQNETAREFERETERAKRLGRIREKMSAGWEGEASTAATGAVGPLADAARTGVEHLNAAQHLHNEEAEFFHRVANSVVPVPDAPPEPTILDQAVPLMSDHDQRVQDYQAAVAHNRDVFKVYDEGTLTVENAITERQYPSTNHTGGDVAMKPSSGGTIDSADYRSPNGTGSGPGGVPSPFGGDSPTPSSRPPAPSGVPVPSDNGTASSNASAGTTSSASQITPSTPPPGTSPAQGAPSTTTGTPGGLVGAGPAVSAAPPGDTGSGVGRGSGRGGLGQRGAGLAGPGVRGGLPGSAIPGGPGAGAGAAAPGGGLAGTTGAAGAAGARGAGTAGMPMGAGAGRGEGDDENEHERKYLQPVDAEGTFGNEELTPPQVIGDPAYEDQ